jgi:hypothetical protein
VVLRVRAESAPAAVSLDGSELTERASAGDFDGATDGWRYDAAARALWVKFPVQSGAATVTY